MQEHKEKNEARWKNIEITSSKEASLEEIAKNLIAHRGRYQEVEQALKDQRFRTPWWFIAIVHIREADGAFDRQLSQGDLLSHVSIHVPKGRGPFLEKPGEKYDAFTRGCLDALIDCAPYAAKNKDWSAGGTLTLFEAYNGFGYASHGIASPYVWSDTNAYTRGKYVSDGVFKAGVVDEQPGCAAILYTMMKLDDSIKFDDK